MCDTKLSDYIEGITKAESIEKLKVFGFNSESIMPDMVKTRERKTDFIKPFWDKGEKPKGVLCFQFYELNWANGCVYDCDYCLPAGSQIFMGDLTWKPIELVRKGEKIVGFDELGLGIGHQRKLRLSVVEEISQRTAVLYRIETTKGVIEATGEHPWLKAKGMHMHQHGGWTQTKYLKKGLCIKWLTHPVFDNEENSDYMIGYLQGAIEGDGSLVENQNRMRFAVKDESFIEITSRYLRELGIQNKISVVSAGSINQAVLVAGRFNYSELKAVLGTVCESRDFVRGYLAGIFDAEGCFSVGAEGGGVIRIANTDEAILQKIERNMRILGFNFIREKASGTRECQYVRLLGGLQEILRFFSMVRPKIKRKWANVFKCGIGGKYQFAEILNVSIIGVSEVFNLQTSTRTFVVDGFPTHNCYLRGTFKWYGWKGKQMTIFSNTDKMFREVSDFLSSKSIKPTILHSGELTDSLANDDGIPIMSRLINMFGKQSKHTLLLLTKSANVDGILNLDHNEMTVAAFSVNPNLVADRYEKSAASPDDRLRAAEKCIDAGYPVMIRVDPMIPVEGWQDAYRELFDRINSMKLRGVVVGTIRAFPALYIYLPVELRKLLTEKDVDGRRHLPIEQRDEIYDLAFSNLKTNRIGICKESGKTWGRLILKHDVKRFICNCLCQA